MIGRILNHYEIIEPLGIGGMGEVYRAHDTTLKRDVAIKVLPEDLSADVERLARLEREAQLLATLNHPSIGAIYGLEEAGGMRFMVLELIEGDTLAERLESGRLGIEEALEIGRQIAEALEAAHNRGIIHRDLKPANVKITPDDQVKVLDFGLAKSYEDEPPARETSPDITDSPTFAAATRTGVILGTAAYMSPEQARAKPLDKRTDVWSFGCVLYEMLSGQKPFGGSTVSDTLAAILTAEPDWDALPGATPASVRRLLRRCLAKDPKRRLRDMGDVWLELEEVPELEERVQQTAEPMPLWRRALPWMVAVFGVSLGIWTLIQPGEVTHPIQVARFSQPSPPLAVRGNGSGSQVAISPDGSMLAYVGGTGHSGQLYLRRLDSTEPVALAGAENVQAPFFSPDGAWVGFQAEREIRRIPVEGGKSWTICEVGYPVGATWGPDGTIVYGDEPNFGLWRVPWDGGEPQRLTTVDREGGEYLHMNPQFLPGGELVLFTALDPASLSKEVALVVLETGERLDLFTHSGSLTRYLASGHIAYGLDGSLMVVPFDLKSRQITGRPEVVLDGLLMGYSLSSFLAHFAVADNGTLTYVSGPLVAAGSRLVRVDRAGNAAPLGQVEKGSLVGPRFSPDGSRLAMFAQISGEPGQVRVQDLSRGTSMRLTLEGEGFWPVWSPDGRRIAFPRLREASPVTNLVWIEADGSSGAEWLTQSELSEQPTTWTPDGKTLIYHRNDHPETAWDVMALEPEETGAPRVLLGTRFNEMLADVSPDGRFIAYASDESGRVEVYVRSYPDLATKWQISTGGGIEPVWSADGRELFYRYQEELGMMAVPITAAPEFVPGRPEMLFQGEYLPSPWWGRNFDVAPDGQSFVMVEHVLPEDIKAELQVVVNWFEELKRLVPTGQ